MVYFVQSPDGGPIKIGYAVCVDRRIRQLERHYDRPLALLATMEGGPEDERAIHERFAHLRLSRVGGRGRRLEQFRPAADLLTFIGRPLLVGANPDAVEAMPGPERNVKPVRLDLDPDDHQMLRVVAAEAGKPMAVFAREVVVATIRKMYGDRRGIRP